MKRLGFGVPSRSVEVLKSPSEFFDRLLVGISNAKKRVSLASLYLGTGDKNQQLLNVMKQKADDPNVSFSLLLDANRSTRMDKGLSSLSLMSQNVLKNVHLFRSPSPMAKMSPARANETFGTQHMKIYVYDDNVIISGANLSTDYFTNRQDRYWVIKDQSLSDYYCDLMDSIKDISSKVDLRDLSRGTGKLFKLVEPVGIPSALKNYKDYKWHGREVITQFIKSSTTKYMTLQNQSNKTAFFVPSIQMGKFFIENDQESLYATLSSLQPESYVSLATAYFNVENPLTDFILRSESHWNILTASPLANGFLGAKGFAGMIPHLYLNREEKFLRQLHRHKKTKICFNEWEKEGHTFHGKGLWISENKDVSPHLSICGSSNYGQRSNNLDLEMQLTLHTSDPELQDKLKEERDELFSNGTQVTFKNFKNTSPHHKKSRKWGIRVAAPLLQGFL